MRLIPSGNLESAEPVLAVRWCLERSEIEYLKYKYAEDIHILIIIKYEGNLEHYENNLDEGDLVPIGQLMAYLNFRKPGNHTVYAKVIYSSDIKKTKRDILIKQSHTQYRYRLLSIDGHSWWENPIIDYASFTHIEAEMDVSIPKEHFPAEPPLWLKSIVNYGHEFPAVDPCMFRRRLIYCLPKLPLFGAWAVITTLLRLVIALVATFLGFRGVNWKAVFRPWADSIEDVVNGTSLKTNWFVNDKYGEERPIWFTLLNPIIMFIVINVCVGLGKILILLIKMMAIKPIIAAFVGVGIVVISTILYFVISKIIERKLQMETGEYYRIKRNQEEHRLEDWYNELSQTIGCKTTPIRADVSDLPKRKRSVQLRFLKIKARVCKPYAR